MARGSLEGSIFWNQSVATTASNELMSSSSAWMMPAFKKHLPPVVLPYTVCFLCVATIVGFLRYASGRQAVTWDRTALDVSTQ